MCRIDLTTGWSVVQWTITMFRLSFHTKTYVCPDVFLLFQSSHQFLLLKYILKTAVTYPTTESPGSSINLNDPYYFGCNIRKQQLKQSLSFISCTIVYINHRISFPKPICLIIHLFFISFGERNKAYVHSSQRRTPHRLERELTLRSPPYLWTNQM